MYSRAQLILTCQDFGYQSGAKNEYDKHVELFFPVSTQLSQPRHPASSHLTVIW